MHEKLTSTDEAHDEENLFGRLENVAHADKEWMVGFKQNIFLEFGRFHLVILQNHVFAQRLHRIHFF